MNFTADGKRKEYKIKGPGAICNFLCLIVPESETNLF